MSPNVKELVQFGYCVSPNNIWSLPGVCVYPAGPGIPEYPQRSLVDVAVADDGVRIVRSTWDDGKFTGLVTEAKFATVAEFIAWLEVNGVPSLPGLPAYAQGWD